MPSYAEEVRQQFESIDDDELRQRIRSGYLTEEAEKIAKEILRGRKGPVDAEAPNIGVEADSAPSFTRSSDYSGEKKPTWISLRRNEAVDHPAYGIKGAAAFLRAVSIILPAFGGVQAIVEMSQIMNLRKGSLHAIDYILVLPSIIFFLWSGQNAILLGEHKAAFIRSFLAFLVFCPIISIVVVLIWTGSYAGYGGSGVSIGIVSILLAWSVWAAIWVPYVLCSRRINVTLLCRVKSDDLFLKNRIELPEGANALMAAIHEDNVERVEDIVSKNTVGINDQDAEGRTALHYAVFKHRLDMLEILLAAGADSELAARNGVTARRIAERESWTDGISHLDKLGSERIGKKISEAEPEQIATQPMGYATQPEPIAVVPALPQVASAVIESSIAVTPDQVPVLQHPSDTAVKLRNLNAIFKEGLIDQTDFENKKAEILKSM